MTVVMVAPHARLFRIRLRLAMAGDPAASCLRAGLGGRLRLWDSRTLALGHAKTPLIASTQDRAATT
jgi:hypothetical protein